MPGGVTQRCVHKPCRRAGGAACFEWVQRGIRRADLRHLPGRMSRSLLRTEGEACSLQQTGEASSGRRLLLKFQVCVQLCLDPPPPHLDTMANLFFPALHDLRGRKCPQLQKFVPLSGPTCKIASLRRFQLDVHAGGARPCSGTPALHPVISQAPLVYPRSLELGPQPPDFLASPYSLPRQQP